MRYDRTKDQATLAGTLDHRIGSVGPCLLVLWSIVPTGKWCGHHDSTFGFMKVVFHPENFFFI